MWWCFFVLDGKRDFELICLSWSCVWKVQVEIFFFYFEFFVIMGIRWKGFRVSGVGVRGGEIEIWMLDVQLDLIDLIVLFKVLFSFKLFYRWFLQVFGFGLDYLEIFGFSFKSYFDDVFDCSIRSLILRGLGWFFVKVSSLDLRFVAYRGWWCNRRWWELLLLLVLGFQMLFCLSFSFFYV